MNPDLIPIIFFGSYIIIGFVFTRSVAVWHRLTDGDDWAGGYIGAAIFWPIVMIVMAANWLATGIEKRWKWPRRVEYYANIALAHFDRLLTAILAKFVRKTDV